MGLDDPADHLGFVSRPFAAVELVSLSETQNTTLQLQLWATKMPILHLDPNCKPNPPSGRITQHADYVRADGVSRGFMRDIPGVFEAPDESGRLIIRAVNDNARPAHWFGRSLVQRMVRMFRAWGRT